MTQSSKEQQNSQQSTSQTLDPNTTYQIAVSQIGLVSQEIYNRFSAMLTIHGFFLAAIGLFFNIGTHKLLSNIIIMGVCVAGFVLCASWRKFVAHGIKAQEFFRRKAAETEKRFGNTVDIFCELTQSPLVEEGKQNSSRSGFGSTATQVIRIFECLYLFLFILSLLLLLLNLFSVFVGLTSCLTRIT
jgi:hypothetical protein